MPENAKTDPQKPPEPDATPPENHPGGPNAEAAKWRQKLRETEAEREQLKVWKGERLHADATKLVAEKMTDPDDFWAVAKLDARCVLTTPSSRRRRYAKPWNQHDVGP